MLSVATAALSFSAQSSMRPTRTQGASMAVEDLVGGINDPIFGGTPEGKIFDPLGLGADEAALYRRRCVEIKHGRICMVATLGMTVGPNEVRAARGVAHTAVVACACWWGGRRRERVRRPWHSIDGCSSYRRVPRAGQWRDKRRRITRLHHLRFADVSRFSTGFPSAVHPVARAPLPQRRPALR